MTTEITPCLYCRQHGRQSKSVEHYLPERFGHEHPFTLPPGAVCDGCQNYASHDLDRCLWDADTGSKLSLWRSRVPGKRGKRGVLQGEGYRLDPEAGTARFVPTAPLTVDHRSEQLFLARGLHKVALGHLAQCRGLAYATHPRFDDVARYIKQAKPLELRPYARAYGRWITEDVQIAFAMSTGDELIVVGMQLATATYWVVLAGDAAILGDFVETVPFCRVIRTAPNDVGNEPWSTLLFCEPGPIVEVRRGELTPEGRFTQAFLTEEPIQRLRLDVPIWDLALVRVTSPP